MEINEYNPEADIDLQKIGVRAEENKPEENKVGFLTFREI